VIARVAAGGALAAAIVVVVLILFGGGSSYTLKLQFSDASGLVTGNLVMIGPATVGSVQSVGLSPAGAAQVTISVQSEAAPMHEGTQAKIVENSLSGIADHYIVLNPAPQSAPVISSGGVIPETNTTAEVSLDQLFDSLDSPTRQGLRGFIQGEAAAIQGKSSEANQTLQYFAPALTSTSDVTQELTRDEPAFDGLLVQGAQAMTQLASRAQELTQLISNGDQATGAIASQSHNLETALSLLPGALNHTTTTYAGLRATLNSLDPVINASKPASRQLRPFAIELRQLSEASIPTLAELSNLLVNPSGSGDLLTLLKDTPGLAKIAIPAFPRLIHEMNFSQDQLNAFREYTPDVVAALSNLGQAGAYYDANGHYVRTQPVFDEFAVDGANQLEPMPANENRYSGLQVVHGRCPGSAIQPTADGSAPWVVPGCNSKAVLPGP
jgi:phospholipid/cholesterol/gamma-HCH transport system substrate-binding protein